MSVAGHDVCILRVAVWARDTCGIAIAAAPVTPAPSRNLRRVDFEVVDRCDVIKVPPMRDGLPVFCADRAD
jgi:hypothetical protein